MPSSLQQLFQQALSGLPDPPAAGELLIRPVGGGSINATYQVFRDRRCWFGKVNDAHRFPGLFGKEAMGLGLLARQQIIRTPLTFACTTLDDRQVLILEWIDPGPRTDAFWPLFGEQLARLHRQTAPAFGLDHDNYMGALSQDNITCGNWVEFFIRRRLEPQVQMASDSGLLSHAAREKFHRLYRHLPAIFPPEPPALLHGDLWSGNFMCDTQGCPVLIDPAVYYGHRSMDLAMTTLFGGFDHAFYEAYAYHYPLADNYREQWNIANLYPLLIHLNLFGQGYLANILQTIQRF